LDATLRPFLARYDLPAVAAAIIKKGEVVASGAVGTRRAGTDTPVSVEDRFHIGSDTKAMTSLLAATLVEGGRITWGTTVGEVFPELTATMDPAVRAVTLEQLLSHTSGIPSDTDGHDKLIQQSFALEKRNLDELRYWIIQQLITQPLQSQPGKQFAYANMGYMLAGAMLERVTGRTWEELIVMRLFDPMGLKSAWAGTAVVARPSRRPARACFARRSDPEGASRRTWRRQPGGHGTSRHGSYVGARLRALGGLERRERQARSDVGDGGDRSQAAHPGHRDGSKAGRGAWYPSRRRIRIRLAHHSGTVFS
jgi:CubicO group peptidase (beta-lactamase class C family)